jgi:hypothetical protein
MYPVEAVVRKPSLEASPHPKQLRSAEPERRPAIVPRPQYSDLSLLERRLGNARIAGELADSVPCTFELVLERRDLAIDLACRALVLALALGVEHDRV